MQLAWAIAVGWWWGLVHERLFGLTVFAWLGELSLSCLPATTEPDAETHDDQDDYDRCHTGDDANGTRRYAHLAFVVSVGLRRVRRCAGPGTRATFSTSCRRCGCRGLSKEASAPTSKRDPAGAGEEIPRRDGGEVLGHQLHAGVHRGPRYALVLGIVGREGKLATILPLLDSRALYISAVEQLGNMS